MPADNSRLNCSLLDSDLFQEGMQETNWRKMRPRCLVSRWVDGKKERGWWVTREEVRKTRKKGFMVLVANKMRMGMGWGGGARKEWGSDWCRGRDIVKLLFL